MLGLDIPIINQILFVSVVFTVLILNVFVFNANPKNSLGKIFLAYSITIILWLFTTEISKAITNTTALLWLSRFNYSIIFSHIFISVFFVTNFPKKLVLPKIVTITTLVLGSIAMLLPLLNGAVVKNYDGIANANGSFAYLFWIIFTLFGGYLVYLFRKNVTACSKRERDLANFFLIGIVVYFAANILFVFILNNLFQTTKFSFVGDYSVILYLIFTAYSVTRSKYINRQIITTQILVFCVWLALFIGIVSIGRSIALETIMFFLLIVSCAIILRNKNLEIQKRDNLEQVLRDLDKANTNLKDLDQTKDNFLSLASHELNTPIAAIEGYLSMILEENFGGQISPKTRQYLESVSSSSKKLSTLVRGLLNVSRIESGRIHLIYEQRNIDEIIDQVLSKYSARVKEKNLIVSFKKNVNPALKTWLDSTRISEVISQIIDNAIKYSNLEGKIDIASTSDDHKIYISIKDHGKGIQRNKLRSVFDKFNKLDVLKDQVDGPGLGLFIAKNFIELHHGRITVHSTVGKGSTFLFTLPILKEKPFDSHEGEGEILH